MVLGTLESVEFTTGSLGQDKKTYQMPQNIHIAIYYKDETKLTNSPLYIEATHTALSKTKAKRGDRITVAGIAYEVIKAAPSARFTSLLLKEL